jgi:hypothetical protein
LPVRLPEQPHEDIAMKTIAKMIAALGLAGAVLAPETVSGASMLRMRASDPVDFHKYLPALPADVPWLTAHRQAPERGALPEAGSLSAWMLMPKPAEGWALTSQPAALRPAAGCKRC